MVRIDPAKFTAAADAFDTISGQAMNYAIEARGTLSGYGGMAGTDPGGESFSEAYDQMAAAALQTLYDIGVASRGLDRALMATGGTHAQANGNAEGIVYDAASEFVLRPEIPETSVVPPPSAFGGRPDTMVQGLDDVAGWVWDQVLNLVGTLFPDGDPEKLDQAGAAWESILGDIRSLRTDIRMADNGLAGIESGEVSSITTKVNEFADGLTTFLSTDNGIGAIDDICTEYATTIRETLEETRQMIAQLVLEVIAGAGISFALSFVTFGAAGAVGAGAIAARIAVIAGRIAALVSRCVGTASRLAIRLRAIVAGMRTAGATFPKLTRVGIELVSGTTATVLAETVQGGDANYLAAFTSGFAGGSISSAITAPFGAAGSRFAVRALSNGAGGAGGTVVDLGVRGEDITVSNVAMGAGLGVAMSARLPGRRGPATSSGGGGGGVTTPVPARIPGRRGPAAASGGDGGGVHVADYDGPSGAGDAATGSAVDGAAPRTEYDGPAGQGGDASGGGGDGSSASSNHGEAPVATDVVVTPEGSGGGADGTPTSTDGTVGGDSGPADASAPEAPTAANDAPAGDGTSSGDGGANGQGTTTSGGDGPPASRGEGGAGSEGEGGRPAGTRTRSDADADADADGSTADGDADADADGTSDADADAAGTTPDADADADADGTAPDGDADGTTPDGSNSDGDALGNSTPDGTTADADGTTPAAEGMTTDADADGTTPDADGTTPDGADADAAASGSTSTNPRVQTLVDADGNTMSFRDWDAIHGDPDVPLNQRKGEFGELHAQNHMETQGWTRIDDGADGSHNPNAHGVDGIYSRERPDGSTEYSVIEAKYNTARLGDTADGRQMSRPWIRNRLDDGLGDASPEVRADVRAALRRGDLESGVVRVTPDGDVHVRGLDNDGYVVRGSGDEFASAPAQDSTHSGAADDAAASGQPTSGSESAAEPVGQSASDVSATADSSATGDAPGQADSVTTSTDTVAAQGEQLSPERVQELADQGYHVAFFDGRAYDSYYEPVQNPQPTLGAPGGKFWVMPLEDGAHVGSVADAYRATGASPAMTRAYTGYEVDMVTAEPILSQPVPDSERGVYAVLFQPDAANAPARPTVADSGGWPHYLENPDATADHGHTAVLLGEGAGYLTNPHIREYVVDGGSLIGPGSMIVRVEDGNWIAERVF